MYIFSGRTEDTNKKSSILFSRRQFRFDDNGNFEAIQRLVHN